MVKQKKHARYAIRKNYAINWAILGALDFKAKDLIGQLNQQCSYYFLQTKGQKPADKKRCSKGSCNSKLTSGKCGARVSITSIKSTAHALYHDNGPLKSIWRESFALKVQISNHGLVHLTLCSRELES